MRRFFDSAGMGFSTLNDKPVPRARRRAMPTTYAARTAHAVPAEHERLDWGPARLDPEHPLHPGGLDLRDDAGQRPDDN
jgi:hypothetical protein